MKQLDVIHELDRVFGNRKLRNHAGERGIIKYGDSGSMTAIVLDLSVSKQILLSQSFESFNYFDAGYRQLSRSKYSFDLVRHFFDEGPIFLEGDIHRSAIRTFNALLKDQGDKLGIIASRIRDVMKNRRHRFNTALDFSRLFVEICLGTMISNLLSIPLKVSLRALRARGNVFYFHFHPRRHGIANDALALLDRKIPPAGRSPTTDINRLLCHGLIVMAYDPLVATICANLVEGRGGDFGASTDRYCPTSFVSRNCVKPVNIGGISFAEGDTCYVSLVPAIDEGSAGGLPFGAGVHICVGRKVSIQILQLAAQIIDADFKEGFGKKPVVSPDGAFLSFRN